MAESSPSLINRLRASWFGAFSSIFLARGISSAATFLTIAVLGRTLGRAYYGDLVILLTVMKVASELVGPALDTALVRFVGAANSEDGPPSVQYVRAVLRAKLALALAILVIGALLVWPLHALYSGDDGPSLPVYAFALAFAGAASGVLYSFVQSYFQAYQQFTTYAFFEVGGAMLRLIAVSALAWMGTATVVNLFVAYAGAPLLVAAVAAIPMLRQLQTAEAVSPEVWRTLWEFTKWVVAACAFTSLAQRLDVLLVGAFDVPAEAISEYCAAVQLTLLGDLVIITLFTVLLPQASRLHRRDELLAFLRGFRLPTIIGFVALIPLLAGANFIAQATFGDEYIDTGILFALLLVGTAFALGSAPAGATLYGLGNSRSIAALECAKMVAVFTGGVVTVPLFGVFGMAWTVAAVKGTMGVLTYGLALHHVRRRPADETTI